MDNKDKDYDHWEYKKQVQERRLKNKAFEREHSKRQLKKHIESKFNTAIIGIIKRLEDYFGYLWGYGKHYDELTDKEREFLEVWKELRTEILDHGHQQSRAAKQELDLYSVEFERYNYQFLNKDLIQNQKERGDY